MLRVTELRAHEPFAVRVGTSKWWVAGGCGLGESWWSTSQRDLCPGLWGQSTVIMKR